MPETKNAKKINSQNTEIEKKPEQPPLAQDIITLILHIAVIAAIIAAIFLFVFGATAATGEGMSPNINDRDLIFYFRLNRAYLQNQPVVYEHDGKKYIGRIVARAGDTVAITDSGLTVNGYPQADGKSHGETLAAKGGASYPLKLGQDEVFILGDNREKAEDSRMFGAVKLSDIKGVIVAVLRRRDI